MNLFLHLTPEDLTGEGTGAVSVEKLGAATTQLLADWLPATPPPAARSSSAPSST